jgi:hypothetical protein
VLKPELCWQIKIRVSIKAISANRKAIFAAGFLPEK